MLDFLRLTLALSIGPARPDGNGASGRRLADGPALAADPSPTSRRPACGLHQRRNRIARASTSSRARTIDAAAFARSWGLLIDDGSASSSRFLPSLDDKIDVYVYVSDASFAAATANRPLAGTGGYRCAGQSRRGRHRGQPDRFGRRTPLEAENALRHALSHVVAREASTAASRADSTRGWPPISSSPVPARWPATPRWCRTPAPGAT